MSATEIGRRLKKARLDAGLTQKQVSDILGITYQAISNYERGINRVDTDTLTKLCKVYGIHISDLLHTPAWTSEMLNAYNNANTPEEKDNFISLWGTPSELLETENNRREPDLNPLTPEDEELLFKFHSLNPDGQSSVLSVLDNEFTSISPNETSQLRNINGRQEQKEINTLRIAGRDGFYHEHVLSDGQLAAIKAILDQLPDADDL